MNNKYKTTATSTATSSSNAASASAAIMHSHSSTSSSSSTLSSHANFPPHSTHINATKTTIFNKLSSSSTSSISSTFSMINGNENHPNMPINPFEETNKFRLEQSVLSPNLFHVANTSTPEVVFKFYFI